MKRTIAALVILGFTSTVAHAAENPLRQEMVDAVFAALSKAHECRDALNDPAYYASVKEMGAERLQALGVVRKDAARIVEEIAVKVEAEPAALPADETTRQACLTAMQDGHKAIEDIYEKASAAIRADSGENPLRQEMIDAVFANMSKAHECRDALDDPAHYNGAKEGGADLLQPVGVLRKDAVRMVEEMAVKIEANTAALPADATTRKACLAAMQDGYKAMYAILDRASAASRKDSAGN